MKKQDLIRLLELGGLLEEDLISILSRQIEATLEWSDDSKEGKAQALQTLQKLASDTQRHKKVLLAVNKNINERGRDVY